MNGLLRLLHAVLEGEPALFAKGANVERLEGREI
jgi:hypothetical protein